MRVLQIADLYPPLIGGTERHTQRLAAELARRGHHSAVATLAVPGAPAFEVEPEGARVHRIQGAWSTKVPGAHADHRPHHPSFVDPGVTRALRRIVEAEKPDVIYGHNWSLYSYMPLAARYGLPVVSVLHDYGAVCPSRSLLATDGTRCDHSTPAATLACARAHYGNFKGTVLGAGLLHAQRTHHRRVDEFFAVSSFVADASRPGVAGRPVRVVPTFIADGLAHVADTTPRPGFLPQGDYILFVGALSAFKGLHTLLEAYQRLRTTHPDIPDLVVIGTRKHDTPTTFPAGVHVHHDVPHAQVMSAWKHAMFGVIPSVWPEPFGQVGAEAATTGTPVVASGYGGLADVVTDNHTGLLVPPGDAAALAEGMARLAGDTQLRTRLGATAAAGADRFTVSSVAGTIEDRLAELIAARRPATALATA